jgi:DNA-directed RNA polymerase subunit RPC12/RpoP
MSTTFTYKCVDCGTKNKAEYPALDNMLHCQKCGFPTVQVCVTVTHSNRGRAEGTGS